MDVQSTTVTSTSTLTTTEEEVEPSSSTSSITSDFDTFLSLLTAQLENQDPLDPIDSSDFADQLATFSGVEQQVLTNDLLTEISEGLGASSLTQLAGWVGMEARVEAPAYFDGTPITLAPEIDPASDDATLVVRDETGREVSRAPMPTAEETVLWAGVGSDGAPLPTGTYTFEVESLNNGEVTSVTSVDHYARVVEARSGTGGVDLVLAGGETVASDTIEALREPQSTI